MPNTPIRQLVEPCFEQQVDLRNKQHVDQQVKKMVQLLVSSSRTGHTTRIVRDGCGEKTMRSESRLSTAPREAELLLGDNVLAIRSTGELLRLSVGARVSLAAVLMLWFLLLLQVQMLPLGQEGMNM